MDIGHEVGKSLPGRCMGSARALGRDMLVTCGWQRGQYGGSSGRGLQRGMYLGR